MLLAELLERNYLTHLIQIYSIYLLLQVLADELVDRIVVLLLVELEELEEMGEAD